MNLENTYSSLSIYNAGHDAGYAAGKAAVSAVNGILKASRSRGGNGVATLTMSLGAGRTISITKLYDSGNLQNPTKIFNVTDGTHTLNSTGSFTTTSNCTLTMEISVYAGNENTQVSYSCEYSIT